MNFEYGVVSIKAIRYDTELLRGGTYKTKYNDLFYDAVIIDIGESNVIYNRRRFCFKFIYLFEVLKN